MTNLLWSPNAIGFLIRVLFSVANKKIAFIPNNQKLWRAICKPEQMKKGKIKPSFFRDKRGMSCDLAIFSSIEKSRRGCLLPPWPENSGLIEFSVNTIRLLHSDISHHPLKRNKNNPRRRKNYAHCQLTTELGKDELDLICSNLHCAVVFQPNF
jgi:hypothetical protein